MKLDQAPTAILKPAIVPPKVHVGISVQGRTALVTDDLGVQVAEFVSSEGGNERVIATRLAACWNACRPVVNPEVKVPALAAFAESVANLNAEGDKIRGYGTVELDIQDAYALLTRVIKEARNLVQSTDYKPSREFSEEVQDARDYRAEREEVRA